MNVCIDESRNENRVTEIDVFTGRRIVPRTNPRDRVPFHTDCCITEGRRAYRKHPPRVIPNHLVGDRFRELSPGRQMSVGSVPRMNHSRITFTSRTIAVSDKR